MTYLQLCQRLATESGISGTLSTTANQIGSLGRIVAWIGDYWNDLQTSRDDWDWLRSSSILGGGVSFSPAYGQFTTPLGTGSGQLGIAVDGFGKWDRPTFRCYTTSLVMTGGFVGDPSDGSFVGDPSGGFVGDPSQPQTATGVPTDEMFLWEIPYDEWRDDYMLGARRSVRTRPVSIAIGPDESLNLGPPPNGNYTITGDYWMAPSLMVNDTDVPIGLPTRYHMLIVYGALFKYGYYEAAPDVLQRAEYEWGRMIRQLEALRLPYMGFGGSL